MIKHIQTVYPVSEILKKHIHCFYIINSNSASFRSIHYSYPHTFNAVSIYSGASFECSYTSLKVKGNVNAAPVCIIQGKRQEPLLVDMQGTFSRITIIFKPLGINHFINQPLGHIMGNSPALFSAWDNEAFTKTLQIVFSQHHLTTSIQLLEDFLCSIYRPFELPQLTHALNYLNDFDNGKTVEEIAALINLSLRTFNRLFKLHLGVSPITHQRIARFRQTLENKLFSEKYKNLTDIGYQSNFYDQSQFIKLYNQLSGINPTALFNSIEPLGDSKLAFRFVKNP